MKTIRLKHLSINNFMGTKKREVDFSEKTVINGRNGVGKSTIASSVFWLLFDKSQSGHSATDIRPHDIDGNDIHNLEICVEGTFCVDGRDIQIKKIQKENWVKKRGSDTLTNAGNINTFSVNGIPKSSAEYKTYIDENFCDEKTFLFCTSTRSFFNASTKDKRAILLSLAGDVTDERVIATNTEYEPLKDLLLDGTVDQLMKRSKDTIKKADSERSYIPPRIDELNKQIVDVDVAEQELLANDLRKELESVESEISEVSASSNKEEIEKQMNDIQIRGKEIVDSYKERNRISFEEYKTRVAQANRSGPMTNSRNSTERLIRQYEESIEHDNREIARMQKNQIEASDMEFDPDSLVCPTCGQLFPEEKQTEIKENFRMHKGDMLAEAKTYLGKLQDRVKENQGKIEELQLELVRVDEQLEEIRKNTEIAKASKPKELDVNEDREYIDLKNRYAELKEKLSIDNSEISSRLEELNAKKSDIKSRLDEAYTKISIPVRNAEIEERIGELRKKQKELSQAIADETRTLDLLERFNRDKMNLLSEEVNKNFKLVKVSLFEEQLNGGIADTCEILVNGSDYTTVLNTGAKMLADLDILTTFQRVNEIDGFIVIDNAEALNDFNIPDVDRQLILLKVAENKDLEVIND